MEIKEETCEVLNTAWLPEEPQEPWPLFIVSLKALGKLAVGRLEAVTKGVGWETHSMLNPKELKASSGCGSSHYPCPSGHWALCSRT